VESFLSEICGSSHQFFVTPEPIYICGATASGKSALAIDIAREYDGEIVNADAFQLYRDVEILTAAPDATQLAAVPHHLYGILDPTESIDAGKYIRLARPAIEEIQSRGKTPVVTGGSGLYLKFLTHGPAPLPRGDDAMRAEMDARPLDDLVAQLRELDPVEAERTALQNRRYVSRALEICLVTGMRASDLRDQWNARTAEVEASLRGIWIVRPRSDLHARIAIRTGMMLDGGALDEVAKITSPGPNCQKIIGFREIRQHLAGETTRSECEDAINTATRQYAKRQETWFRREHWLTVRHEEASCFPGTTTLVKCDPITYCFSVKAK